MTVLDLIITFLRLTFNPLLLERTQKVILFETSLKNLKQYLNL
jgi:hypothetical protein